MIVDIIKKLKNRDLAGFTFFSKINSHKKKYYENYEFNGQADMSADCVWASLH